MISNNFNECVFVCAPMIDWVKPLTPPGSAIIHPTAKSATANKRHHNHHQHINHNHHQQQQQQLQQHQQQQDEIDAEIDFYPSTFERSDCEDDSVAQLALRLQAELRAAKSRHLACTEVLLPADLLNRVAADMVDMSEKEPCGIRGCSVFIEFEDEPGNSRRIASLEVGANTVSTFELYLTLRHDQTGWTAKLPQFLK